MINRWIGICCLLLMLSANTTLFMRDILPGWLAGDPPTLVDLTQEADSERRIQTGVFDVHDRCVGRSWTLMFRQATHVHIESKTLLYPFNLPNGTSTPMVRIDTTLKYRQEDNVLDSLNMEVRGLPIGVVLNGELYPLDEFVCTWKLGKHDEGSFTLNAAATRAMGAVMQPFTRLPGLYVGRTWRMEMLDPLTQLMPGVNADNLLADAELVRVTGTEKITHRGRELEAFVVETKRAKAWVTQQGDVLRQELELPLFGRLTLRNEPFDEGAYERARQWLSNVPEE